MSQFSVGQDVKWKGGGANWGTVVLIFAHYDILENLTEMFVIHQSTDDGSVVYVVKSTNELAYL